MAGISVTPGLAVSTFMRGLLDDADAAELLASITPAAIVKAIDFDALTTGQSTIRRRDAITAATMTSQQLRLTYFTAVKSETIASIRMVTGSTAAGATPTLVRAGIYTVAGNGDLTLVASTANDTTLLAAPNTSYTKALSSSYAVTAGTRYAVGLLVVTAAAAPTVPAWGGTLNATELVGPRFAASLSGQSNLPSTPTDASLSASGSPLYAVLVP